MADSPSSDGSTEKPRRARNDPTLEGGAIKAWRLHRDLSQERLLTKVNKDLKPGITRLRLSQIENGLARVTAPQRKALARALNITTAHLAGGRRPEQGIRPSMSMRRMVRPSSVTGLASRLDDIVGELAVIKITLQDLHTELRALFAHLRGDGSETELPTPNEMADAVGVFFSSQRKEKRAAEIANQELTVGSFEIRGLKNAARLAIRLLEEAAKREPIFNNPEDRTIWVSSQYAVDWLNASGIHRREWQKAVSGALRASYETLHFMRRDTSDPSYSRTVADDICKSFSACLYPHAFYKPFFIDDNAAPISAELPDYVLVPGLGCLALPGISSTDLESPESYRADFYPVGHARYQQGVEHMHTLQTRSMSVLRIMHSNDTDTIDFAERVYQAEAVTALRCLVLYGPSETIIPSEVHEARGRDLAIGEKLPSEVITKISDIRRRRSEEFERQLKKGRNKNGSTVFDLCSKQALLDLIREGKTAPDDVFTVRGARDLKPAECLQVIERIVKYLRYDSYHLGLADVAQENWPEFWLVKQDNTVLIEVRRPGIDGHEGQISIQVSDPGIANAFYDRFFSEEFWGNPQVLKDKDLIRDWLKRQLRHYHPNYTARW